MEGKPIITKYLIVFPPSLSHIPQSLIWVSRGHLPNKLPILKGLFQSLLLKGTQIKMTSIRLIDSVPWGHNLQLTQVDEPFSIH